MPSKNTGTGDDAYAILGISPEQLDTQDGERKLKSAYRRAALRVHPDKRPATEREAAEDDFKRIALAYATLSNPRRRARYDRTGSMEEIQDADDEDFDWATFFDQQYASVVDAEAIEKARAEYVGSEEERADVLRAYKRRKGDWHKLFCDVMFSVELEEADELRFRRYVEDAFSTGELSAKERFEIFFNEPKAARRKRLSRAQAEADEAAKLGDELQSERSVKRRKHGGSAQGARAAETVSSEADLATLILARQRERGRQLSSMNEHNLSALAQHFEMKYGGSSKKSKKQKRGHETNLGKNPDAAPPSEEEFQKARQRLEEKRRAKFAKS
ncbi:hypothetical protein PYCC9005_003754 [Savitreella phatthalungensis]